MNKLEKNFFKKFDPGVRLIFAALFLSVLSSYFYSKKVFTVELCVLALLYYYYYRTNRTRQKDVVHYFENLTHHVDSAAKNSLLNFPLPMVIIRTNGEISWYNSHFGDIMGEAYLFEKQVSSVMPGFDVKAAAEGELQQGVHCELEGRYFRLYPSPIRQADGSPPRLVTVYLVEETELNGLRREIYDRRVVVGMLMLDNYDEIMQSAKEIEKVNATAIADEMITAWAEENGGAIQKYEKDKYTFIMEAPVIDRLIAERFRILDNIKEIVVGASRMPITISIGIGRDSESLVEKKSFAMAAIEMALGRGGDQVVIKTPRNFEFYGGHSKAVEKRTKVKSRVVTTALKELIAQSDSVYIMGHKYCDVDAMGAAAGIFRMAGCMDKNAKIIISHKSVIIEKLMERLQSGSDYEYAFISPNLAQQMVMARSLIVVVDTHRVDYVECPEILEKGNPIVVIDHHRRSEKYIENPTLLYHEPYASSTSEMVTEMLQYFDEQGSINKEEATALLSGIILDTKSFTFKTGVRTFAAASFLKRAGADPIEAKKLFQNDFTQYRDKVALVSSAELFHDGIAVAALEDESVHMTKEVFAQAIDEILGLTGIKAAFGIARLEDSVHISARSYGGVNVQVIMEELGGGGHQTMAGAQLKGITVKEAKEKVLAVIDAYMEQEIL